jgi:hypothetical protein
MNARRVEYHQDAAAHVRNAVAWFQERNPRLALDFVAELERAVQTIREAPERWPTAKNNCRRFLLWRFPFSVICSVHESAITILAVATEAGVLTTGLRDDET